MTKRDNEYTWMKQCCQNRYTVLSLANEKMLPILYEIGIIMTSRHSEKTGNQWARPFPTTKLE